MDGEEAKTLLAHDKLEDEIFVVPNAYHPWTLGAVPKKPIADIFRNFMPYSNSRDESDTPRHNFQIPANKMTGIPKV